MVSTLESTTSAIQLKEDSLLAQASDKDFVYRRVHPDDFYKGFPDVLEGLTPVGTNTKQLLVNRYNELFPRLADIYKIFVIEDVQKNRIIGAGSVVIERKFIRSLGLVGHIEDVVVEKSYRGKNLGGRLI